MRTARMTGGSAASKAAAKIVRAGNASIVRVRPLDLVEQRFDVAFSSNSRGEARKRSKQQHAEDFRGDPAGDVAGFCAERHADTDLPTALHTE